MRQRRANQRLTQYQPSWFRSLGLEPWVVGFVVRSASNLWLVLYQLAADAYLTFYSASGGYLSKEGARWRRFVNADDDDFACS